MIYIYIWEVKMIIVQQGIDLASLSWIQLKWPFKKRKGKFSTKKKWKGNIVLFFYVELFRCKIIVHVL